MLGQHLLKARERGGLWALGKLREGHATKTSIGSRGRRSAKAISAAFACTLPEFAAMRRRSYAALISARVGLVWWPRVLVLITHSPMQGYNLILADLALSVYLNSSFECQPSDFCGDSIAVFS